MGLSSTAPQGLLRIFSAPSSIEAELLRQVLAEEGFHPEFVVADWVGITGIRGNQDIYLPADEAPAASDFLRSYLAAAPLSAEEGYAAEQGLEQPLPPPTANHEAATATDDRSLLRRVGLFMFVIMSLMGGVALQVPSASDRKLLRSVGLVLWIVIILLFIVVL